MTTTKESESVPMFDTRGYVRTLTRGGSFNEEQANANADGLQQALSRVATKADISGVKAEIRVLEARVGLLEEKMDVHFQALQEQMRTLRQMMVVGFSVVATSVLVSTLLL